MARTPIDDALIHPADAATPDGRMQALCNAFGPGALAWAQTALVNEAAELAADEWIAEARAALVGVLREPGRIASLDLAGATEALSREIAAEIPTPDADEIAAHGAAVARTLAAAWSELLASRADAHAALDDALMPRDDADAAAALDDALMPRAHADAAAALDDALDEFGLRGEALRAVLRSGARALFGSGVREVELPLDVRLVRAASGGFEVRRAVDGPSTALAHSGERVRDDVVAPARPARTEPRRR